MTRAKKREVRQECLTYMYVGRVSRAREAIQIIEAAVAAERDETEDP